MPLSVHQMTVPAFTAMLTNMKGWLDKSAALKPEAELMEARLAPDMYPLARQFQITSDIAKGTIARLSGVDAPAMPDTESSFADLKDRCDRTIAYVQSADRDALEAGLGRTITVTFPTGGGMRFDGLTYLTGFCLPNFYFHASTAYDILRNQGAELGKADLLTHLMPNIFGMELAQT